MGYTFTATTNMVLDGLVHMAWRDIKKSSHTRGLVLLACNAHWVRRKSLTPTRRRATCLKCIALMLVERTST